MLKCKCCGLLVDPDEMTPPKQNRCRICNKLNSYFSNHKLKGEDHIQEEIQKLHKTIKDCELRIQGWEYILNGTPVYKAIKPLAQEERYARHQD